MKKSLISGLIITTMLLSACNTSVSTSGQIDNSVKGTTESTITESTSETIETTLAQTEEKEVYTFMWGDKASEEFDKYVQKKTGNYLFSYVCCYGFTDELNRLYTDFVNSYYSTSYKSVPFSTSNYFYAYLVLPYNKGLLRDYECFKIAFLNNQKCFKGTFNNKLILSYLVQNEIPFGTPVPVECFSSLDSNYLKTEYDSKYFINNPKLGNLDNAHKYTTEESLRLLELYNFNFSYIYYTEGIKDHNLLGKTELVDMFNGFLVQYYGENAPQFGEVITKDQYRAMFGEDPLDLSYIPGAVINQKAS